jgi:D-inositol-3-phosphate glycosyltransferase
MRVPALRVADRAVRTVVEGARSFRAIAVARPDVIHFQLVSTVVDQWWIPRACANRVGVMTVHNVVPHDRSLAFSPSSTRRVLEAMDALVVHGPANAKELAHLHPDLADRIRVIRHGVWDPGSVPGKTEARAALGLPLDKLMVLCVGVIRRNKRFDAAITALSLLPDDTRSRTVLVIAGAPSKEVSTAELRAHAARVGVADAVVWRDAFLREEELRLYFASADVVALPYSLEFKAQSGVLLESYAYGAPVVVTEAGALGDTVREDGTGLVAADDSPRAFAASLQTLVEDEGLRHHMGRQMRDLARTKYAWSTVGAETYALYERLLAAKRAVEERPTA